MQSNVKKLRYDKITKYMKPSKKIDFIMMNPPYNKDLHLKFLEKTIEIADIVVNISPHDWLTNKFAKTEKSKFRRDFR